MQQLERWESDVVLADGGAVRVRPIRPDDADRLVRFHSRLSQETVYLRFFSPHPRLFDSEVERFTNVDFESRVALVAVLDDEIVAVGRYDRLPDTTDAEAAFVVADEHQGRGLGTLLLEHLTAIAREKGITRFVAETLANNRGMLAVFSEAGFAVDRRLEDGVVHVAFAIEPTEASVTAVRDREHYSEARSIRRLLHPRSVAVVGAGRDPGSVGHAALVNLLRSEFAGPVYPVNPTARSIAGVRAYARVSDIPDPVDLAVIAVPPDAILGVVEDCAARHVNSLVVLSAGFAELGSEGVHLERELVRRARGHGMRVVGPNCIGVVNTDPEVRLNAIFAGPVPDRGRIGVLSQSGALGVAILDAANRAGVGISTFVSVGNKADVSGNDMLQFWEDDPGTAVILLYLESFGNPRKFARLARRIGHKKPIIAVKSGRTTTGTRAAMSHTAAMATSDTAVDALFHEAGVIRVDSASQMLDVGRLVVHQPLPAGRRLAIVGNSGGPGILAADAADGAGLQVPELSAALQDELRALLGPTAAVANPIDMTAAANPTSYERALEAVLGSAEIDSAVVIVTPTATLPARDAGEAIVTATSSSPVAVAAAFVAGAPGPLLGESVPVYASGEDAVAAIARAAAHSAWRARREGSVPALDGIDRDAARAVVEQALARGEPGWLTVEEATAMLAAYGLSVVTTAAVDSAAAAVDAAEGAGYPVALKASGPTIVHKTELGAVQLGLGDAAAVRAAYEDLLARLGPAMTGAVVQPMAAPGVETIVGVVQDPSFGPVLMFGMGGTAAELIGDRAFRLVPLEDVDAADLVRAPRTAPLLFGYRGSAPVDTAAIEDVLLRVGRMAEDNPELVEMDINPLIASSRGAVIVDVRARVADVTRPPDVRRLR